MIHVIGDSHCGFFTGITKYFPVPPASFYPKWWAEKVETECLIPYFKVYHLGAFLAYNLIEDGKGGRERFFDLIEFEKFPKKSKLLLSFGEIDCRAHLLKQAEIQSLPIDVIVEKCVDRYIKFLEEISAMEYVVWAWGPVAQNNNEKMSYNNYPNEPFVNFGSHVERNNITKLFNSMLHERYPKSIDILEILIDENGNTKNEYYRDLIHLNQKAMPYTIDKMQKIGLIDNVG